MYTVIRKIKGGLDTGHAASDNYHITHCGISLKVQYNSLHYP